jgi:hypothetical protein
MCKVSWPKLATTRGIKKGSPLFYVAHFFFSRVLVHIKKNDSKEKKKVQDQVATKEA